MSQSMGDVPRNKDPKSYKMQIYMQASFSSAEPDGPPQITFYTIS